MDDIWLDRNKIPKIDAKTLGQLSTLKPWRSFLAIFMDWSIIILCIILCERLGYWLYPLAFIIAGSRFHALEAMMHEATHYRLHPNKKINDIVGELAIWPLGDSLFLYRKLRHFAHHRNIGTRRDSHILQLYEKHSPRYTMPKTLPQLIASCLLVAVRFPAEVWIGQIYQTAKFLPLFSKRLGAAWIAFQIIIIICVVAGSALYGPIVARIYFLFFVLPLLWVAIFSRYLRLLTEHFGLPGEQSHSIQGGETRTVLVAWPIRIIFWPHNLNYHTEHHWYPSVPFYNLPALHAALIDSPPARQRMHITSGLNSLIHELTSP
jgi:fatty acid desaturase